MKGRSADDQYHECDEIGEWQCTYAAPGLFRFISTDGMLEAQSRQGCVDLWANGEEYIHICEFDRFMELLRQLPAHSGDV